MTKTRPSQTQTQCSLPPRTVRLASLKTLLADDVSLSFMFILDPESSLDTSASLRTPSLSSLSVNPAIVGFGKGQSDNDRARAIPFGQNTYASLYLAGGCRDSQCSGDAGDDRTGVLKGELSYFKENKLVIKFGAFQRLKPFLKVACGRIKILWSPQERKRGRPNWPVSRRPDARIPPTPPSWPRWHSRTAAHSARERPAVPS